MRKKILITILPFVFSCAGTIQQECPVCTPKVVEKPIIIKCEVPEVPEAQLEEVKKEDSYEEKLRKLIHNYGRLKEENVILRKALEVCK